MDGQRFDNLTRQIAVVTSRRRVLKGAVGGIVAGIVGRGVAGAASGCRGLGKSCTDDNACCSSVCEFDKRGRGRCGECPEQTCAQYEYFDPRVCQCVCSYDRQVCGDGEVCTKPLGCIEQCDEDHRHCTAGGPCAACCSNGDCPEPGLSCMTAVCDERGQCVNVIDPNACLIDGACVTRGTDNPANTCQTCDPASNAVGWTARTLGTVCGDPASCKDGTLTPGQTCNSAGQCVTGTPVSCGQFLCDANGSSCYTSCTSDAQCLGDAHCAGNVCVDDSGLGLACDGDGDCLSGHCAATVSGGRVCCDTACDGICQACGADGACGPASNISCNAGGGSTCCNGACLDLRHNTSSCGSCDNACAPSTDPCMVVDCVDGACTPVPDNGAPCSTGNACQQNEFCFSGVCGNGEPVVCDSENPCIIDSCDPTRGCVQEMKIAGSSCDDGNPCNGNEICDGAGNCQAGTPVVCHPSDQCHGMGVCDPESGVCSDPPLSGTPCNDGDPSTCSETCYEGVCSGTTTDFDTDPDNCGGCGNNCPAWTGDSSATCGGNGQCCSDSAGICCPYGVSRPSTCQEPCGTSQCYCHYEYYTCGFSTCSSWVCSTCIDYCDVPCCR